MTGLATRDEQRLTELEDIIGRGLKTFVEVGQALMEIRQMRLYRQSYATFEDYCRTRWEMGRNYANKLIRAAQVAEIIATEGTTVPIPSERLARGLAPLLGNGDEPAVLDAWAEVIELHPDPTAENVHEVVGRYMDVHYSSTTDDWSTPQDLFDLLDAEFGFDLDVCATADSAKCARFFTEADDGLAQNWTGVCWMNPPYGDAISRWVTKAFESSQNPGTVVVCLVPARVDTGWWWASCRYGEIRFLRGRLKFGGGDTSAPFPSAVVVFPSIPRVVWWER